MNLIKLIKLTVMLSVLLIASLVPRAANAAPPVDGPGQTYVVQADDWLSKLADKFYGDPLAYSVIFEATNAKAGQDDSYQPIADPDLIEIGQKLFIPDDPAISEEALAAVETEEEEFMPPEVVAEGVSSAPSPEQQALLASLDVKGTPPELHNEVWLNSEPLKLADLRDQVVIVEFWTFG